MVNWRTLSYGVVLAWLLAPIAGADTHAAPVPPGQTRPAPNVSPGTERPMFLVARRSMGDPRFRETVLFLVKHSEEGTLGLVVNRPTQLLLAQVAPDLRAVQETNHAVFLGGPVNPDLIVFLALSRKPLPAAEHLTDNLYFGVARETLEALLAQRTPASELRVFAGYAGWSPGQLEAEMTHGDWLLVPADVDRIFAKNPESLWQNLIEEQEPAGNLVKVSRPEKLLAGGMRENAMARLQDLSY
jgi:putative transcriptional regulator